MTAERDGHCFLVLFHVKNRVRPDTGAAVQGQPVGHRELPSLTIDEAFARARTILAANKALLIESAHALLTAETLSEADLRPFAARLVAPPNNKT